MMHDLRCSGHTSRGDCRRLLGRVTDNQAVVEIKCSACKEVTQFPLVPSSTAA